MPDSKSTLYAVAAVLCWACDADRLSATSATQGPAAVRTETQMETDKPTPQQRNPRYQLSRGDTLEVLFPFAPEFNQTVTVNPDGFVNLTEVGDLYISGKTVSEAKDLLLSRYARILHDPVINLVLKDFEKPYFIAGGELAHPGKFDLRGDTTLTEAIAIAGGFTENSKHSQVLLFRRVSHDWAEVRVLNVKKMFQAGNLSEDVHLQPGDMFVVPQNRISKVKKWIPYTSVSTGATPSF
jgi:polysaccharide biosynthesis/export protein